MFITDSVTHLQNVRVYVYVCAYVCECLCVCVGGGGVFKRNERIRNYLDVHYIVKWHFRWSNYQIYDSNVKYDCTFKSSGWRL